MAALRSGDIVRIRDERWTISRHVTHGDCSVVDVRGCDRTNRGAAARFLLPFEPNDRQPPNRSTRIVSPRRWRRLARRALAAADPPYDSLKALATARIDIHAFQLEPALAVVRGMAARLLIADAVGLGKTIQAGLVIAEVLARAADGRALVVCPASLREQWASELEQRFGLPAIVLDATAVARLSTHAVPGANPWMAHPLVIASMDFVKRVEVLRALERAVWDVVVIDEAHGLSGRSDRHAAATLLGERARTLALLTATPHSGNEEAFRRLCAIGDLPPRFPLAVFRRTRHDVGLAESRRTTWLNVTPTPAERQTYDAVIAYARLVWRQKHDTAGEARLAMCVLLRRAASSASSLARSIERRLQLLTTSPDDEGQGQLTLPFGAPDTDDEPSQQLAAPGLTDAGLETRMLRDILALARTAQARESKVLVLRRYLERTREPAIVFTEYRDTLAMLVERLASLGCVELHGGCTAAERRQVLQQFVNGETRVLLATDAASEGLNLQRRCRVVIHLEVPWTPLRAEQRVGRVDRIGQPRRVHQLYLVATKTPEAASVVPLLRRRTIRACEVLDALRPRDPSHQEIADALLSVDPRHQPELPRDTRLDEQLVVLDLRHAASAEAERVAHVPHDMSSRAPVPSARPFGAALQPGASRGIWAFRVGVADVDDELLWETILGVEFLAGTTAPTRARALATHFDRGGAQLQPHVLTYRESLVRSVGAALSSSTALAVTREQAILATIEVRRARLAAALVQSTLFGRRSDRGGMVQQDVLDDVAGRCRAHLARLRRRRRPVALEPEPLFAVIRR